MFNKIIIINKRISKIVFLYGKLNVMINTKKKQSSFFHQIFMFIYQKIEAAHNP